MVVDGFRARPPIAMCPFCKKAYGMIETTDKSDVYRYQCWCGASSMLMATEDELRIIFDIPFTCPRCHKTSHNPHDAKAKYCGACHAFTGDRGHPDDEVGTGLQ